MYNYFILVILLFLFIKIKDKTENKPNKIKFYYNYFVVIFSCFFGGTLSLPYGFCRPKHPRTARITSSLMKITSKVLNKDLKWYLRNANKFDNVNGAVVVANHQSIFDILGLFGLMGVVYNITIVAKKIIFYMWPAGLAGYLGGIIYIDRKDGKTAYKQLQEISHALTHNQVKLWMYPEGTRNKNPTKFLPFKKGAFSMAIEAQVPIVPVVHSPYYFIDAKKYIFNKGHIIMQCLDPIPTKGLTQDDIPDLIQKVHDRMFAVYQQLSAEVKEHPQHSTNPDDLLL